MALGTETTGNKIFGYDRFSHFMYIIEIAEHIRSHQGRVPTHVPINIVQIILEPWYHNLNKWLFFQIPRNSS